MNSCSPMLILASSVLYSFAAYADICDVKLTDFSYNTTIGIEKTKYIDAYKRLICRSDIGSKGNKYNGGFSIPILSEAGVPMKADGTVDLSRFSNWKKTECESFEAFSSDEEARLFLQSSLPPQLVEIVRECKDRVDGVYCDVTENNDKYANFVVTFEKNSGQTERIRPRAFVENGVFSEGNRNRLRVENFYLGPNEFVVQKKDPKKPVAFTFDAPPEGRCVQFAAPIPDIQVTAEIWGSVEKDEFSGTDETWASPTVTCEQAQSFSVPISRPGMGVPLSGTVTADALPCGSTVSTTAAVRDGKFFIDGTVRGCRKSTGWDVVTGGGGGAKISYEYCAEEHKATSFSGRAELIWKNRTSSTLSRVTRKASGQAGSAIVMKYQDDSVLAKYEFILSINNLNEPGSAIVVTSDEVPSSGSYYEKGDVTVNFDKSLGVLTVTRRKPTGISLEEVRKFAEPVLKSFGEEAVK